MYLKLFALLICCLIFCPNVYSQCGVLITGITARDLTLLKSHSPHTTYRVLNKKHGLVEVFGTDAASLKLFFPTKIVETNRTFTIVHDPASKSNHRSDPLALDFLASTSLQEFPQFAWNHVLEAWKYATGKGVIIAVLDSGVNDKHSDLKDNMWTNSGEIPNNGIDDDDNGKIDDFMGWNFITQTPNASDDQMHGSFVAGLAAGKTTGVAPQAKIMPLKVASANGMIDEGRIAEAIYYAVDMGAQVLNMSFGGPTLSQSVFAAIQSAESNGILIVASAGNEHVDDDTHPNLPGTAREPNIICVAALDTHNEIGLFSNYGLHTVDLAAKVGDPGNGVVGPWYNPEQRRYENNVGTSAAAPIVAGTAALLLEINPHLNATELKEILINSGNPLPSLKDKLVSGKTLDVFAAVQLLVARGL